jgi:hypothetical protein
LASATGKDIQVIALEALENQLARNTESRTSAADKWHARFDAVLASMPRGNPPAEFSREGIYD